MTMQTATIPSSSVFSPDETSFVSEAPAQPPPAAIDAAGASQPDYDTPETIQVFSSNRFRGNEFVLYQVENRTTGMWEARIVSAHENRLVPDLMVHVSDRKLTRADFGRQQPAWQGLLAAEKDLNAATNIAAADATDGNIALDVAGGVILGNLMGPIKTLAMIPEGLARNGLWLLKNPVRIYERLQDAILPGDQSKWGTDNPLNFEEGLRFSEANVLGSKVQHMEDAIGDFLNIDTRSTTYSISSFLSGLALAKASGGNRGASAARRLPGELDADGFSQLIQTAPVDEILAGLARVPDETLQAGLSQMPGMRPALISRLKALRMPAARAAIQRLEVPSATQAPHPVAQPAAPSVDDLVSVAVNNFTPAQRALFKSVLKSRLAGLAPVDAVNRLAEIAENPALMADLQATASLIAAESLLGSGRDFGQASLSLRPGVGDSDLVAEAFEINASTSLSNPDTSLAIPMVLRTPVGDVPVMALGTAAELASTLRSDAMQAGDRVLFYDPALARAGGGTAEGIYRALTPSRRDKAAGAVASAADDEIEWEHNLSGGLVLTPQNIHLRDLQSGSTFATDTVAALTGRGIDVTSPNSMVTPDQIDIARHLYTSPEGQTIRDLPGQVFAHPEHAEVAAAKAIRRFMHSYDITSDYEVVLLVQSTPQGYRVMDTFTIGAKGGGSVDWPAVHSQLQPGPDGQTYLSIVHYHPYATRNDHPVSLQATLSGTDVETGFRLANRYGTGGIVSIDSATGTITRFGRLDDLSEPGVRIIGGEGILPRTVQDNFNDRRISSENALSDEARRMISLDPETATAADLDVYQALDYGALAPPSEDNRQFTELLQWAQSAELGITPGNYMTADGEILSRRTLNGTTFQDVTGSAIFSNPDTEKTHGVDDLLAATQAMLIPPEALDADGTVIPGRLDVLGLTGAGLMPTAFDKTGTAYRINSRPLSDGTTHYLFKIDSAGGQEGLHIHRFRRRVRVINGDTSSYYYVAGQVPSPTEKAEPVVLPGDGRIAGYRVTLPPNSVTEIDIPAGTVHAFGTENGDETIYYSIHYDDRRDAAISGVPVESASLLDELSLNLASESEGRVQFLEMGRIFPEGENVTGAAEVPPVESIGLERLNTAQRSFAEATATTPRAIGQDGTVFLTTTISETGEARLFAVRSDGSSSSVGIASEADFDTVTPPTEERVGDVFGPSDPTRPWTTLEIPSETTATDYFAVQTAADLRTEFLTRNGIDPQSKVGANGHDVFSHMLQTANEHNGSVMNLSDVVDNVVWKLAEGWSPDQIRSEIRDVLREKGYSGIVFEDSSVDYVLSQVEHNAALNGISVETFAKRLDQDDLTLLLQRPSSHPLDARPR